MTADVAAQRFVDIMRKWDDDERDCADAVAMKELEELYRQMMAEGRTG